MKSLTESEHNLAMGISPTSFYEEIKDLSKETRKVEVFEWEGEYFTGIVDTLYRLYKATNPSKKFRIWLIDEGFRLDFN